VDCTGEPFTSAKVLSSDYTKVLPTPQLLYLQQQSMSAQLQQKKCCGTHASGLCLTHINFAIVVNLCLVCPAANRYTGFGRGMQETYKKTPFMAQLETKNPKPESFVFTRTCTSPKQTYGSMQRDPCNHTEERQKPEQDNLWPCLQDRAAQV
jgi:hypothetical protein